MKDDRVLVYSTDGSLPLPKTPKAVRSGPPRAPQVPDDGVVRVAREKRRAGIMTIVTGLPSSEVEAAAKTLRRLCGSGGTAKNGVVELQGDHRDRIVAYFEGLNRRVKRAGG